MIRHPLDHENVRGHHRPWVSFFVIEQQVPGHVYVRLRAEVLPQHIDRVQEVIPLKVAFRHRLSVRLGYSTGTRVSREPVVPTPPHDRRLRVASQSSGYHTAHPPRRQPL